MIDDEAIELSIRIFVKKNAFCPECQGSLTPSVEDILISVPCHGCGAELYFEAEEGASERYPVQ